TSGKGLPELKAALAASVRQPRRDRLVVLPEVHEAALGLTGRLQSAGHHLSAYEVERALIDARGVAERRFEYATSPELMGELSDLRMRLSAGSSLAAMEAKARYDLIKGIVSEVETRVPPQPSFGERLDRITNHPVI
ncbi:MAG: hypothetical protein L6Q83_05905, partial [Gammaproteobacteria bacterium]|nr:hypothetical protein [Gammaproteobacteria bacterium]